MEKKHVSVILVFIFVMILIAGFFLKDNLNVMKYFGISAVPTHLILDNQGNEIFRKYGFVPAEELLDMNPER